MIPLFLFELFTTLLIIAEKKLCKVAIATLIKKITKSWEKNL